MLCMDSSSLHCSTPMPAATASSRSRSSRRRPAGPCCRCCAPASGHRARKSSKSCVTSSVASDATGPRSRSWCAATVTSRTPEVMDLLEEKRCGYIFGLSTNPRLTEIGRPWSEDVATGRALSKTEKMRRFFQTSYAAASWSKPRKVVARVEASEQGSDIRFIVTNLPGRAKVLYEKVYCARGRMENLIKDMKLYTRSDRTSCHRWEANQFRLFLHMGAYWLLHELRGAAPKRSIWRTATFETIRCTFLKIAVRIQELKTRIKMALPSSYPHVQALTALATSIAALAP